MTSQASSVAVALAQQSDAEIVEALSLLFSLRPDLQASFAQICNASVAPRLVGTISCFYPEKRYGFIKCEEVTQSFGLDTFLSDQELNGFAVGSVVSFTVVTNKDGKPQARMLSDPPPASQSAWKPAVTVEPPKATRRPRPQEMEVLPIGAPPQKTPRMVTPPQADLGMTAAADFPATDHDGSKLYTGTISAFYEQKHFGFIKSEACTNDFGMDAFLSDKEIGGFGVGSLVAFNAVANKDGKPQARNLRPADGELDAFESDPEVLALAGQMTDMNSLVGFLQQPIQPDWQNARASSFASQEPSFDQDSGRFVGVIKCFIPERHYGFLNSPECTTQYGYDAFLSDKEIGSFNNDDTVSFSVRVNKAGKPQAYDLQPAVA